METKERKKIKGDGKIEDWIMTEKDWKDLEEHWEKQYREDYVNKS